MITFFILLPIAAVFMLINCALGCYIAIRLGFGPPNWQTALNLIVPLTTLQDCLNACRDWLSEKYPKADDVFIRLRIPNPIVIVDTTPWDDEEEDEDEDKGKEEAGEIPEEKENQEDVQTTEEQESDDEQSALD